MGGMQHICKKTSQMVAVSVMLLFPKIHRCSLLTILVISGSCPVELDLQEELRHTERGHLRVQAQELHPHGSGTLQNDHERDWESETKGPEGSSPRSEWSWQQAEPWPLPWC